MAEKIKYEAEYDVSDAVKGANKLNKSIDEVGKSVEDTNKDLSKGEKQAGRLSKAFGSIAGVIKGGFGVGIAMSALDKLGEGIMANQQAQDLMNKAGIVFQGVINGIIEVLKPLFDWMGKAFKEPQKYIKELGQMIVDNIKVRFEGLIELIPKLGEAIGLLFKGEFSKAGKVAFDAVAKVGLGVENMSDKVVKASNTIGKHTKKAFDMSDALIKARKNFEKLGILYQGIVEKYDLMAEKQRQIRDDDQRAFDERIKANEELANVLDEGLKKEKANIEARIGAKRLELQLNKNSVEIQNEILSLQQELTGVDAKYAGLKSEQLTNINSLQKEQSDLIKGVTQAEVEASKTIQDANAEAITSYEDRYKAQIEAITEQYNANAKLNEDELAKVKEGSTRYYELLAERKQLDAQFYADSNAAMTTYYTEKDAKAKEDLEKEKALQEKRIDVAKQVVSAIGDLAGENAEMGKAVAIAQAIIDTYTGATKALAQGGVLGYVGAGAIIASGFANIRKIMQTEIPNSDGGSSSGSGSGQSLPSMPSVGVIGGQTNSNLQLVSALNSGNKPVKTYVVGQDVTSQQSLDRHILQNTTF